MRGCYYLSIVSYDNLFGKPMVGNPSNGQVPSFNSVNDRFEPSDIVKKTFLSAGFVQSANITGTKYFVPSGRFIPVSIDSQSKLIIPKSCVIKNAYCYVYLNDGSNKTLTLRKNGVDTSLVITILASTLGVFSNTTDSVSFSQGDTINWKLSVPALKNIRISSASLEVDI